MAFERMTARKVKISDLMNGKWVKKEGMEPSFIVTSYGEQVSRARILGTVVAKFLAEDGNFGSITLDDSTDTIRAKTFKTVKPLEEVEIGDIVDAIGKVREYNAEIYFIPEIIYKVQDPNLEILRRLEIEKKLAEWKKSPQKPAEEKEPEGFDKDTLRKEILKVVEASPEGAGYSDILGRRDLL
jgi:RPA family protein